MQLWFWVNVAMATNWGRPKPYVQPILSGGAVSVNRTTGVQLTGGAQAGVFVRDRDVPHWLSHTRTAASLTYGLTSGSIGADVRVGSFIGPDGKVIRYLVGPDVFFNGYGQSGADDYRLNWAPGVDLSNQVLVKLSKPVVLVGELTPGWVFAADRQNPDVFPFHQVDMLAAVVLRTEVIRVTVGVRRTYNQAGVIDGLVLSGAL